MKCIVERSWLLNVSFLTPNRINVQAGISTYHIVQEDDVRELEQSEIGKKLKWIHLVTEL